MLQFIGTLAVVVSVLVLAYQTREVARQTRFANQVAGSVAQRDMVFNWRRWAHVFIDHGRRPTGRHRLRLRHERRRRGGCHLGLRRKAHQCQHSRQSTTLK